MCSLHARGRRCGGAPWGCPDPWVHHRRWKKFGVRVRDECSGAGCTRNEEDQQACDNQLETPRETISWVRSFPCGHSYGFRPYWRRSPLNWDIVVGGTFNFSSLTVKETWIRRRENAPTTLHIHMRQKGRPVKSFSNDTLREH
jgi:hypothetical protein